MRKYSTFEQLHTRFNPDLQCRFLDNAEVAYFSSTPTIGLVSETYGRENAAIWMKAQLMSVDFYNGTSREGDYASIGEAAMLFVRQYGRVKLTEFMLFVARFKLGWYGKFYGSFDPIALGEAFRKFLRERVQEMGEIERRRGRKDVSEEFRPPEGYSSLTWYQELKRRAAAGDGEAAQLLKPPAERRKLSLPDF